MNYGPAAQVVLVDPGMHEKIPEEFGQSFRALER